MNDDDKDGAQIDTDEGWGFGLKLLLLGTLGLGAWTLVTYQLDLWRDRKRYSKEFWSSSNAPGATWR